MTNKFAQIAMALAVLASMMVAGCSEKKNDVKEQMQKGNTETEKTVSETPAKRKRKVPLDSSRIVTIKDYDRTDSIMVGVRAFNRAEEEFVKRWNYKENTEYFLHVVDQICGGTRHCASMKDSVAYQDDVSLILDSLMRNNILDSMLEAKRVSIEKKKACYEMEIPPKECDEKISERIRKDVMKRMKEKGLVK